MNFDQVDERLEGALGQGVFPGCVLLVNLDGRVVYFRAFGSRSLEPQGAAMEKEIIFDLSSLTKAIATATAFMVLVQERKVRVDDRVTRFFHNFGVHGKTHITFRHLLNHSSGLPHWKPYYQEILDAEKKRTNFVASLGAKDYIYQQIHRE
jgi:CubicO group peptidase (beta-lactamase class C family)